MDYKTYISGKLSQITDIPAEEIYKLIEVPPKQDMGDFAFP